MTEGERTQRHLEICRREYERLMAEGKWPWPDSQNPEDLVESEERQKIYEPVFWIHSSIHPEAT